MISIGIVVGSTRPGRKAEAVAHWVYDLASMRQDATFELVDIQDYGLPLLDEETLPRLALYSHAHTRAWSQRIASFGSFVFVTPEYNHGTSGALKNAIDYLYLEWTNKAVGFVSYGSAGGTRAVEQLRQIAGGVEMADVRAQVSLSTFTDFDRERGFVPAAAHERSLNAMLDQVIAWGTALKPLREAPK